MAKRYQELIAWQLAEQSRREIVRFTSRSTVARDRKFCEQIQASASSVSANIAEGFARFSHRDFARFLQIARSSAAETQVHLGNARDRQYLSDSECQRLWILSERALAAITSLHTYLRTHPDPVYPRR
jgi:four helix bundle protein